jgi:hypothetical protein
VTSVIAEFPLSKSRNVMWEMKYGKCEDRKLGASPYALCRTQVGDRIPVFLLLLANNLWLWE